MFHKYLNVMNRKYILFLAVFLLLINNCFGQSGWTWSYPLPTGEDIYSIKFTDQNTGYTCGYNGTLLKTTNGGNDWIIQSKITKDFFHDVCFVNSMTGFAAGYNYTSTSSIIYKTTDGGSNWLINYTSPGF